MIQKLSYCYKNNKFIIIKSLLAKFSLLRKVKIIHTNFFRALLEKGAGKTSLGFTAWKNMPLQKDDAKIRRANKMERTLSHLVTKCLKVNAGMLQKQYEEGISTK